MKKLILLLFVLSPIMLNAQETNYISVPNPPLRKPLIGSWFSYEQSLGAWDNLFISFGGVSFGVSIAGFSVGFSVYGNFPFYNPSTWEGLHIVYGGLSLGYKTTWLFPIKLRALVNFSIGSMTINSFQGEYLPMFLNFVFQPSFFVDFDLINGFILSVGFSYRYFAMPSDHILSDINDINNGMAFIIGIGWLM